MAPRAARLDNERGLYALGVLSAEPLLGQGAKSSDDLLSRSWHEVGAVRPTRRCLGSGTPRLGTRSAQRNILICRGSAGGWLADFELFVTEVGDEVEGAA
jgi:hypothetical protein